MDEFTMITVSINSKLDNNTLQLSTNLAKVLGMQDSRNVVFYVGQVQRPMRVVLRDHDQAADSISMNPVAAKRMFLHSGRKYGIRFCEDEVHLGPVVGIMADTSKESQRPFAGQSFFIKQLLASGNQLGELCFAFSPHSIDWTRKSISGYTFGKSGWVKGVFPIPDVVYPRERAYSQGKLLIRSRLARMGVILINPFLVGKWQTHKILMANPDLQPFLPDTRLVKSFKSVESMLSKYHAVYLKPIGGSQGKNIIRVIKRKGSLRFEYQYELNNRTCRGSAGDISSLQRSLRKIMGGRVYIVQKQINLLHCDGKILDVRILVQKDHSGQWDTTGMACRVGRPGSITSNISAGGSGRKLDFILEQHFSDQGLRKRIVNQLKFVAEEAAKTIENALGPAGEMGVDIGIDKDGRVWFIEANLKPARQVFNLIGEPQTRLRSVEKPMLYARYLAGF